MSVGTRDEMFSSIRILYQAFVIHCVCQENYCGPFNITSRVYETGYKLELLKKFAKVTL